MKEQDEIREKEVTTGKQLLEKLSLQQGQNPTEYEHFKENAEKSR